ncbi:MAG TPA: inorganic phosphate transporter [Candidatus Thermoplasmatota archaeon]|nr:inorganic phosphate transporter [Candidatus Thermoplasmatota archaeon]
MLEAFTAFVVDHPFITVAIVVALIFDFVNGFHDSANAIATVIATKVLTPGQALLMAGIFNFLGPFLFGTAVAGAVGAGIIDLSVFATAALPSVIFAALVGAIIWNLVTWYVGLPSSSSHALVGGLVGAGLAAVGPRGLILPTWAEAEGVAKFAAIGGLVGIAGGLAALWISRVGIPRRAFVPMTIVGGLALGVFFLRADPLPVLALAPIMKWSFAFVIALLVGAFGGAILWTITQRRMGADLLPVVAGFGIVVSIAIGVLTKALVLHKLTATLLFMVLSPLLGFLAGFLLMAVVAWLSSAMEPGRASVRFKRLQLASAAFYSLTHGTNDAQKTMGIIAVLLLAAGAATGGITATSLHVPTWVIFASALAMGIGTLFGGQRIIHTMATKITHLTPAQGFAASAAGGVVLAGMAEAGIPVSTTHAISGSIMGVGATRGVSAVRWGIGRRIVGAWVLTIPASALVAYVTYVAARLLGA